MTLEFYLFMSAYNIMMGAVGLAIYLFAFGVRWWGMKSLGDQWAIHAVGARKIRKVRLIKFGPYKYIRHPIYLAIMLEVLSLPLIANALYTLCFSILINVPLQYIRMRFEEGSSARRFGNKYNQYRQEVDALLPIKYIRGRILTKNLSR